MMSRHPSSADLAAFRAATWDAYQPADSMGYVPMHPHHGGAWQRELRDGIGYRHSGDPRMVDSAWAIARLDSMHGRREASSLRSRAYAAKGMASQWLVPVHPQSGGAWYAERVDGAPYQWHTYGRRGPVTVASDTWTDDEAPRAPLPITYHAAFTITR